MPRLRLYPLRKISYVVLALHANEEYMLTVCLDANIHNLFRRVGDGVTAELDFWALVAQSLANRRSCRRHTSTSDTVLQLQ